MWDWFVRFLYQILDSLAGLTGDWGIAVIVLTVIIRIILVPLMTKSTASSAKMQALQPLMKDIQERYADDPERQAKEMQKFYADNKFNPLGGCLPILLQMPVFFALFTVARQVPKTAHFLSILPSLSASAASTLASGGSSAAAIYIFLVLLFGVLTLVPMLMNAGNTPEEQRNQMIIMGVGMALMMVWVGWGLPAAVILYYDTSAIWQVIQQKLVMQRVMDQVKADMQAKLEAQGIQNNISVVRREYKPRQHKKS
ncbi:YidC/Oxa1 family membrane protein insertase [Olegusella massiliensis]|nr:YidC/Oxa1 family membrane protein insertase [Olegusella massiliensis]ERL13109.1 60Kd inner membrane protein [Coriobacteriaceae bacterium BV3Ac1]MBS5865148.1 YidC/Oxa1 family membrane protein insertase [Coriobacteriaceae bacterium]